MLTNEAIIPYVGTDSIKLYQTIDKVKTTLQSLKIPFREELWSSENETVPNPWTVLIIDGVMSLYFAKNKKLFKIVFWEGYQGSLPNGISPGTSIEEAESIDPSLLYEDWDEVYLSDYGYWLEDNIKTKTIMSVCIFIKELLDDDTFDYCNW